MKFIAIYIAVTPHWNQGWGRRGCYYAEDDWVYIQVGTILDELKAKLPDKESRRTKENREEYSDTTFIYITRGVEHKDQIYFPINLENFEGRQFNLDKDTLIDQFNAVEHSIYKVDGEAKDMNQSSTGKTNLEAKE